MYYNEIGVSTWLHINTKWEKMGYLDFSYYEKTRCSGKTNGHECRRKEKKVDWRKYG